MTPEYGIRWGWRASDCFWSGFGAHGFWPRLALAESAEREVWEGEGGPAVDDDAQVARHIADRNTSSAAAHAWRTPSVSGAWMRALNREP